MKQPFKISIWCLVLFTVIVTAYFAWPNLASAEKSLLSVGSKAPMFSAKATGFQYVRLADYIGKKHVVLVFYPMDNTPGCSVQLCALRDEKAKFDAEDAVILALNPGKRDSHEKFRKKHAFTFPLLEDKGNKMAYAYRTKGTVLNHRTVYIIDKKGMIQFAERGMPSNGTLLSVLQKLNSPN